MSGFDSGVSVIAGPTPVSEGESSQAEEDGQQFEEEEEEEVAISNTERTLENQQETDPVTVKVSTGTR